MHIDTPRASIEVSIKSWSTKSTNASIPVQKFEAFSRWLIDRGLFMFIAFKLNLNRQLWQNILVFLFSQGCNPIFLFKLNKNSLADILCCLFSIFNKKFPRGKFSSIFPQILDIYWFCWRVVTCVCLFNLWTTNSLCINQYSITNIFLCNRSQLRGK
jgi:hypothetical protein